MYGISPHCLNMSSGTWRSGLQANGLLRSPTLSIGIYLAVIKWQAGKSLKWRFNGKHIYK